MDKLNDSLLGMLRILPDGDKLDWKSHVNKVVHAYNCTKNDITGYLPFELLFGQKNKIAHGSHLLRSFSLGTAEIQNSRGLPKLRYATVG